jgi:hypothetical protein
VSDSHQKMTLAESARLAGMERQRLNDMFQKGIIRPPGTVPLAPAGPQGHRRFTMTETFAVAVIAHLIKAGVNNRDILARVFKHLSTSNIPAQLAAGDRFLLVNNADALVVADGGTVRTEAPAVAVQIDLRQSWDAFQQRIASQKAVQARQDAPTDEEAAGPSEASEASGAGVGACVEDLASK